MSGQSLGDQKIQSIRDSLIFIFRYRLNGLISKGGAESSRIIASLIWKTLSYIMLFFIYLIINILLGVYLARFFNGSLLAGFGCVLLAYGLILFFLVLLRKPIENAIRQALANIVVEIKTEVNDQLSSMPQMATSQEADSCLEDSPRPDQAYEYLVYNANQSRLQADRYVRHLTDDTRYIKENYKQVAFSIATNRIEEKFPMGSYLSSFLHFFEPQSQQVLDRQKQKKSAFWQRLLPKFKQSKESSKQNKAFVRQIRPYLPYVAFAWKIARPTLSALALTKGRKILLRKMLKKSLKASKKR